MRASQRAIILSGTAMLAIIAAPAKAQQGMTSPEPATTQDAAGPVTPSASSSQQTPDAQAQAAADLVPQDPAATAQNDVVVTGSRVARSGYDAPSPTTVIGDAALQQKAAVTIADALNDIPAFAPTVSTGTAGARPFAPGANYANLRSLGVTRTLVLVDGRRFAPSVPSFSTVGANQVDLNLIPPILLERAEVVTGGASAQWGSDAVAGVVNLILNTKFTGLKLELEKGISQRGDNAETRAAGLVGASFAGGRGHLTAAGEYYHNQGVGDIYTRGWGRRESQIVANGAYPNNGIAKAIIADNTRLATQTPGGLITSGPLRGTVFLPGGATTQYEYGTLVGNLLMIGGGIPGLGLATDIKLVPRLDRWSGFSHADFEISPAIKLFAEGSVGENRSNSLSIQPRDAGSITIQVANPFLPAAVRQRAVAAGVTSFSLGRISNDIGHIRVNVRNRNFRVAGGASGDLGGSWSYDAYYQYGRNDYRQDQLNQRINANFTAAANAVSAPAGNRLGVPAGTIVCASSLTNPTNGCVPINLFGDGSPSAAAIDYVTGDLHTTTRYVQQVVAGNLRGEPINTWAGPVSIAVGIEHRAERQRTTADALSIAEQFNSQNIKPLAGSFRVTEGYGEVVVPLIHDQSWTKELDLNGAVRYADYSTVGGVVTWKAGATWTITDWLLLRGTRSRDIRAPNIFELNAQPTPTLSNVIDPRTNTQVPIRQYLSGNTDLNEEKANTTALGIGLKPIARFELSVDYYQIKLDDAILSLQGQATINACQSTGDPLFCNNIIRNAAGTITRVNAPYINLGTLKTEGLDIESSYRFPLIGGNVGLRAIGTYTFHAESSNGFGSIDRVGEVGTNNAGVNPTPRFRGQFTTSYQRGGFFGSVQLNYIAKGKYDAAFVEGVDIEDNTIPDKLYTSLNVSQSIDGAGQFQVYLNVNNLFDVDPPRVPSTTFLFPTNPAFYDTIGRNFRVGVRTKF